MKQWKDLLSSGAPTPTPPGTAPPGITTSRQPDLDEDLVVVGLRERIKLLIAENTANRQRIQYLEAERNCARDELEKRAGAIAVQAARIRALEEALAETRVTP